MNIIIAIVTFILEMYNVEFMYRQLHLKKTIKCRKDYRSMLSDLAYKRGAKWAIKNKYSPQKLQACKQHYKILQYMPIAAISAIIQTFIVDIVVFGLLSLLIRVNLFANPIFFMLLMAIDLPTMTIYCKQNIIIADMFCDIYEELREEEG